MLQNDTWITKRLNEISTCGSIRQVKKTSHAKSRFQRVYPSLTFARIIQANEKVFAPVDL